MTLRLARVGARENNSNPQTLGSWQEFTVANFVAKAVAQLCAQLQLQWQCTVCVLRRSGSAGAQWAGHLLVKIRGGLIGYLSNPFLATYQDLDWLP